jgi:hypothetical protein
MRNFVRVVSKEKLSPDESNTVWHLIEKFTKVNYSTHKEDKNSHICEFTIEQSLPEGHMEHIVKKWYQTSEKECFFENSLPVEDMDDEQMQIMLDELAKYMHNQSIQEKLKSGWKFGEEFSLEQKTSPLLVPFDKLPSEYRKLRPDIFAKVIDILIKNL